MSESIIKEVNVSLWNKINVCFIPNKGVNIIVGINGSGKTTLLNRIEQTYLKDMVDRDSYIYIPSIDNYVVKDKRKKATALSQDLDSYIYNMKNGPSIMYYRMEAMDASLPIQTTIKKRITELCDIVNNLFKDTGKHIAIEGNRFIIETEDSNILLTDDLSSGEKQMLLLLIRVFLLEEKESVVLIDEPENSLDISWQYKLINLLVRLNPNAQFFITTHSPSIFGDGWGDKIIYMEDVTSKIKKEV